MQFYTNFKIKNIQIHKISKRAIIICLYMWDQLFFVLFSMSWSSVEEGTTVTKECVGLNS